MQETVPTAAQTIFIVDDMPGGLESIIDLLPDNGIDYVNPGDDTWYKLTASEDQMSVSLTRPRSFKLKCIVTDSYENEKTDIHSVYINSGGSNPFSADDNDIAMVNPVPDEFLIKGNFPNPFNPQATISFGVPENRYLRIEIYNIRGQRIKILADKEFEAGYHTLKWNSQNDLGNKVTSGLYFVRLKAAGEELIHKLILNR